MSTLHFEDINMHYEVHGSGTPFFLHHGLSSSCQAWYEHVPWLSKKCQLVIFDARGHGLTTAISGIERYSWELMADDVNRLMEHLNVEKAIIGGLSMGGGVSLTFALKYPHKVKALILCDVAGTGERPAGTGGARATPQQFEEREQFIRNYGTVEMARRTIAAGLAPRQVYGNEKWEREYLERNARFPVNGAIYANRFVMTTVAPRKEQTKNISVPTLIVIGEEDTGCKPGADWARETIPNRRYVLLKGVGHSTSRYRPDGWRAAVEPFLDDLAAGRDIRGEVVL